MATREALAIRREAAFARIAAAAGIEPPAANRDPDVTLTQFVEWAADLIAGPEAADVELVEVPNDAELTGDGTGEALPPADDTEKVAAPVARKSRAKKADG